MTVKKAAVKKAPAKVKAVVAPDIVVVDHTEYGIEETKAKDIRAQFQPMLDRMVEMEDEFNEVSLIDVNDPSAAIAAKELRLRYVKVRTGIDKIHKEQKAFYLAAGRFVDGWKNTGTFAAQGIESKLKDIEDYAVNLEYKRVEDLKTARWEMLLPIVEDESFIPEGIGRMTEDIWENYLTGAKASHELRIKAAKALEEKEKEEARVKEVHEARKNDLMGFWHLMEPPLRERNFGELTNEEYASLRKALQRNHDDHVKHLAELEATNEKAKKDEEVRIAKEKAERIAQEAVIAEKLNIFHAILVKHKYTPEGDSYKKENVVITRDRLIQMSEKEFNERILEIEEVLKARAVEVEKVSVKESPVTDNKKSLIDDLLALKTKYTFTSEGDIKMYKATGELLDKIVKYINY